MNGLGIRIITGNSLTRIFIYMTTVTIWYASSICEQFEIYFINSNSHLFRPTYNELVGRKRGPTASTNQQLFLKPQTCPANSTRIFIGRKFPSAQNSPGCFLQSSETHFTTEAHRPEISCRLPLGLASGILLCRAAVAGFVKSRVRDS